ncbi:MAG: hypothetical protein M3440_08870 [Chloroflexota bacterium]|nr:hypothetical protein [Chloroflexota bacterium]
MVRIHQSRILVPGPPSVEPAALAVLVTNDDLNTTHRGRVDNPHGTTKALVGLGNVDNTSDAAKPVSTAQQTALNLKSATTHLHDDRYYTESEVNTLLNAKANSAAFIGGVVSAHQQTTVTALTEIPELSIPVGVNETWVVDYSLNIGCTSTGGVRFAFSWPIGLQFPARVMYQGNGGSLTTLLWDNQYNRDALSAAFSTFNSVNGQLRVAISLVNTTTAGTLQFKFASGVAGQTSTVYSGSYLIARRI